MGHSRGTFVSTNYLGDPARAAKVAKYVAIDGAPCPDVVPCLAPTQADFPGPVPRRGGDLEGVLRHAVRVPGGRDARGGRHRPPARPGRALRPSRQLPGQHRSCGRHARHLGDRRRHRRAGRRTSPTRRFELGADGAFGPFEVETGGPLRVRALGHESPIQHHLYLQPYVREQRLWSACCRRSRTAPPGPTPTSATTTRRSSPSGCGSGTPRTTPDLPRRRDATCSRSAPATKRRSTSSPTSSGNGTIGLHLHDDAATPGESTAGRPALLLDPAVPERGRRVHARRRPADGTITVTQHPPRRPAAPRPSTCPNWPSSGHCISVVFTDYPVD